MDFVKVLPEKPLFLNAMDPLNSMMKPRTKTEVEFAQLIVNAMETEDAIMEDAQEPLVLEFFPTVTPPLVSLMNSAIAVAPATVQMIVTVMVTEDANNQAATVPQEVTAWDLDSSMMSLSTSWDQADALRTVNAMEIENA